MRFIESFNRTFSRPLAIWICFAIVLTTAAAGLAMLSRHALRLSDEQWMIQNQVRLDQNVRVALWRLDSRLGPYIATLHDPAVGNLLHPVSDQFVLARFRIESAGPAGGDRFAFAPATNRASAETSWSRLTSTIAVDDVVTAVDALLPDAGEEADQLVQGYAMQASQEDSFGQRELGNRNAIVQQQVALNAYGVERLREDIKDAGGAGVSEAGNAEANNVRLMSVWIDDHLVVVRTSRTNARELDGVWIDWPALAQSLADEIDDLLPGVHLASVDSFQTIQPSRTLAAIPAMIVPAADEPDVRGISPTHHLLWLAWGALAVCAFLAGVAISRLIALSERRASFVSAVTHELRTPLTTFRLYSDLLARDMVSDPGDRKEYLQTLRREADRLTHLVDNVLRYSKLQSSGHRSALETVVLSEWIERVQPRLRSRLDAAEMELVVTVANDGKWLTDPPAMEQLLFNLVDNAAKYAASAVDRRVHLDATVADKTVELAVTDHGPGVSPSLRRLIFRPFAKSAERAAETAAGVGLGLALARQTAMALGGTLVYRESADGGASFQIRFPRSSGHDSFTEQ